ncbi:MAG: cytochrome-c peroxidase, partial [Nannocystaceae bacterium]
FKEPRLSIDDTISCNSCHNLDGFGVDGLQFSLGVEGQLGGRNAPTVFHAAGHHAQFWDGRAVDVEEQALGPITNPVEMGMPDGDTVVAKLEGIPEYVEAFAAVFPEEANPITFDNVGRAIGAFERGLTHPTQWDTFLGGDDKALTDAEINGLQRFIDTGCNDCHFGTYMGGSMFTKLGAAKAWPDLVEDEGRKQVTGNEEDSFVFKTPSLRLISHTGPYLHDGSISDLHEVVMKMAEYQNGVMLSEEEADEIVTFLNAL